MLYFTYMPVKFQRFRTVVWVYVLTIVGSMVLFAIALVLVGNDITAQSEAVADSKIAQMRQSNFVNNFAHLKTDAVAAASYEAKMKLLLPAEDDLINFPSYISDLARVHAVGHSFSFQGAPVPSDGGVPGYVAFMISVEGPLSQVNDFFTNLNEHTTRFLVNVSGFDLNALGGGKYRVSFSGKVFFRNSP